MKCYKNSEDIELYNLYVYTYIILNKERRYYDLNLNIYDLKVNIYVYTYILYNSNIKNVFYIV